MSDKNYDPNCPHCEQGFLVEDLDKAMQNKEWVARFNRGTGKQIYYARLEQELQKKKEDPKQEDVLYPHEQEELYREAFKGWMFLGNIPCSCRLETRLRNHFWDIWQSDPIDDVSYEEFLKILRPENPLVTILDMSEETFLRCMRTMYDELHGYMVEDDPECRIEYQYQKFHQILRIGDLEYVGECYKPDNPDLMYTNIKDLVIIHADETGSHRSMSDKLLNLTKKRASKQRRTWIHAPNGWNTSIPAYFDLDRLPMTRILKKGCDPNKKTSYISRPGYEIISIRPSTASKSSSKATKTTSSPSTTSKTKPKPKSNTGSSGRIQIMNPVKVLPWTKKIKNAVPVNLNNKNGLIPYSYSNIEEGEEAGDILTELEVAEFILKGNFDIEPSQIVNGTYSD